jgi:sRNA-binding regulator protein Hfq
MAKHHIVQDKYLTQWRKSKAENQLNIYLISQNRYIERGPGWKVFWREDFNIFNESKENFYLPEEAAARIDSLGIETIRKIDGKNDKQLEGFNRCYLSFYVALQYIRTPRFREETNKFMEAVIKLFMREDISSPDKIKLSKDGILKEVPKNKYEEDALKKISTMSDEEIKKQTFEFLHSDNFRVGLTNTGHSKQIFKIDRLAKGLFDSFWLFLVAPKDTSFVTSDNPCFTYSQSKIKQGLLSPNVIVFFPLRPDICITIKPGKKTHKKHFLKLDKKGVCEVNQLILQNSYQCLVAKDKSQLESLTKSYDYKNHRKSRDVVVREIGNYVMFNVE